MVKFTVSDRVKIIKKIEKEKGWESSWVKEMDAWIGVEGKILIVDPINGYYVFSISLNDGWWFPPSSLELVEENA